MSLEVGQELKSLTKAAFTEAQLKEYAAASGDHNPIHLDAQFAAQAGFPSVIVHGMLSMAYIGETVLFNFPAKQYRLAKLSSRFRKVTFPGDSLTISCKVKKVEPTGGWWLSLQARNPKGEVTTDGEALVTLRK